MPVIDSVTYLVGKLMIFGKCTDISNNKMLKISRIYQ